MFVTMSQGSFVNDGFDTHFKHPKKQVSVFLDKKDKFWEIKAVKCFLKLKFHIATVPLVCMHGIANMKSDKSFSQSDDKVSRNMRRSSAQLHTQLTAHGTFHEWEEYLKLKVSHSFRSFIHTIINTSVHLRYFWLRYWLR